MISKLPLARRLLLVIVTLAIATLPLTACDGSGTEVTATAAVQKVTLRAAQALLPADGGQTDITAEVTGTTGEPVANVEVIFTTTEGTLTPGNRANTNANGRATVTLETEKVAKVQAAVLSIVSNEIEIRIDDPVVVFIELLEGVVEVGNQVTFTIRVQEEEKATPVGTAVIDFGDGTTREVEVEGTVEVSHTYGIPGEYQVKVTFTSDESGTQASTSSIIEVLEEVLEITLSLTTSPSQPSAGDPVTFNFSAQREDGEPGRGDLTIDFDDGAVRTFENVSGEGSVQHTYEETGDYDVRARLENTNGDEPVIKRSLKVVDRPQGGAGADDINANQVIYTDISADISNWPITSRVTGVEISRTRICVFHTKADSWPVIGGFGTYGNPWSFANINGQWYGGTWEWLRGGQTCKHFDNVKRAIARLTKSEPMRSWRAKKGELVGFAVSTKARLGKRSIDERTNIVLVPFPY